MQPMAHGQPDHGSTRSTTRRAILTVAGVLPAAPWLFAQDGAAKKKKKKKVTLCLSGATITASSKKKKKLIKNGATPGACTAATCGTNSDCGAGAICVAGTCQTCSVTCNGDSAAWGSALQQKLDQGGTVYVCPGRYAGRFVAGVVTVVGAGSGDDPATSTILDAQGGGRTLSLSNGITASLTRLRVTNGQLSGSSGGGLYAKLCDLTLASCAFVANQAQAGGGLYLEGGRLQVSDTTFSDNIANTYSGGGIFIASNAKATIASSVVTRNRATRPPGPIYGGGILLESAELSMTRCEITNNSSTDGGGGAAVYGSTGILTLDSATRVASNTAGARGGGGILLVSSGRVILNGATVENNTPDNTKTI